jgi:ribosomal protein S18 acetylase RimI-like enzyme
MWEEFTLATSPHQVLGMLHVQKDTVAAIHVDPRFKGFGIGRLLMADAETRIFESHAVARLEVLEPNTAARAFYTRRGWVEVRRFEGEECSVPMQFLEFRKHRPLCV